MHPSIERLLSVQEVDCQIIFLRDAMHRRPLELADVKKQRDAAQTDMDTLAAHIKELKKISDSRELEVQTFDAAVAKLNLTLDQAKTNSEYTVLKEQIRRQEETRGVVEEEILEDYAKLETLEERKKELQEELDFAQQAYQRKESEVGEVLAGLEKQVGALDSKRGELVDGIEKDHLDIYEKVLQRYNDFAIARVDGKVCHGCHMSVTPQEINQLMQGEFLLCRSCYRLLYHE